MQLTANVFDMMPFQEWLNQVEEFRKLRKHNCLFLLFTSVIDLSQES
jgi:hypothetical protein